MTTQRIVVGAHYGLRDWMAQRITAVIIALYSVILLVAVLMLPERSYGAWASLFSGGFMKVTTLLAMLSLIYHAWIGVRDIFMDYVKPTWLRLSLYVATIVLLIAYVLWSVMILWSV